MIERCNKCNLPSHYPGIQFDKSGVCNFCNESKGVIQYLGFEALKNDINRVLHNANPRRKYDCAVGLSGGRDSSYLLYYAKEVLGLKVLAITMDHDFITPTARDNIEMFVKKMDVDIHYIDNNVLNKTSRKSVQSWAKTPDVAMCVTFCTGCRYGLDKLLPEYVRKQNIPLLLKGNTPIEENVEYHVSLLCDGKKENTLNKIIGFSKRLLLNPNYFGSPSTLYYQLMDFVYYDRKRKNPVVIHPFFNYIEWKEEEVMRLIESVGWVKDSLFNTSWRSDCYVGLIRQHFYKMALGYNDIDVYYANLIRNKKMSKEEAMRIKKSIDFYNEKDVRSILKDFYDIDYDAVKRKINTQL